MKKLYTLGIALSMVAFGTQSFAQVKNAANQYHADPVLIAPVMAHSATTSDNEILKTTSDAKSTNVETYWSEDFSNGFEGQNGAWNFGGENGELWFYTYPEGHPEAYVPGEPLSDLPIYGDALGHGSAVPVVNSPSRENGFMMLDANRWFNGGGAPIIATLVSPSIDLSSLDVTHANLVFNQKLRVCCFISGAIVYADVSVDGGAIWVEHDVFYPFGEVNDIINQEVKIDITEAIAGATDLSDVQIRFRWAGNQDHYYWQIDDVSIQSIEENDLESGRTWYNFHSGAFNEWGNENITSVEYYSLFENARTPVYYARPLTHAMAVTNKGSETQTGVQLIVNGIAPDGSTFAVGESDPIDMEYGQTDTLTLPPTAIPNIEVGEYRFTYEVIQNEADATPATNYGDTTSTRFTDESSDFDYKAIMQNAVDMQGSATTTSNNMIYTTPYVFPEVAEGAGVKAITHVEAVFISVPGWVESTVGANVYFNVREGFVYDEDPDNPETTANVLFGSHQLNYEDAILEHTLAPEDIWYADTEPLHYASFQLPSPVLIDPNVIYQAEVRIPFGADVFITRSSPEESMGSLLHDYTDGIWYYLNSAMPIRFRVGDPETVEVKDITYETGITLVQNYPNPFTDVTKIQYNIDKSDNVKLEVRDITGKMVFQKDLGTVPAGTPQSYELQRGSLAPGMYTYSIVTSEFQVSRKLTVQ